MGTTSAVSARKRLANRRNSLRSTGPRTAEGKARSSRNASTHGVFCKDLVLPGEDRRLFEAMRVAILAKLNPQDVIELLLVDRIVSANWRLRRVQAAEAAAHEARAEEMTEEYDAFLHEEGFDDEDEDEDEIEAGDIEGEGENAAAADPKAQPEREPRRRPLKGTLVPAEYTLHALLRDERSVVEKMSLYEKRLEGTIHRCLRDLQKLRTPLKGQQVPSGPTPFLSDAELQCAEPEFLEAAEPEAPEAQAVADDTSKVKNEATAATLASAVLPGDGGPRAGKEGNQDDHHRQIGREVREAVHPGEVRQG